MRNEISSHLVVNNGTTSYSQSVPTEGRNGVNIDLTVISAYIAGTAETISAAIEQSDDLQNWTPVTLTASLYITTTSPAPGYSATATTNTATALSAQYVRVAFSATGAGTRSCVAAGLNFFNFAS